MATTDVVQVVVEILNNTQDELNRIRAELESLGAKDINVDLDINAMSEIAQTETKLQALSRDRVVDMRTRVTPGGTATEALPFHPDTQIWSGGRGFDMPGGGGGSRRGIVGLVSERLDDLNDTLPPARRQLGGIRRTLGRVTPNIMDVWNALAALIPVMVSLGAAAIGLAGAFVALGTAAAAIVGVGLLGWGEDFGSSLENATERARDLGDTLFDVLQPVADTFQPILEGWMEGVPRQVQRLVEPMQELAVFADTLSDAGAGLVGWLADVLRSMAAMEQRISQIAMRFGEVAGGFMIDFMENMVDFAYENQEALIQLSSSIRKLLGVLLEVSIVVASTVSTMSPLIDILAFLADLLNTRLGRAIMTAAALFLTLRAAAAVVTAAVWALSGGLVAVGASIYTNYIVPVLEAIGLTNSWIASLNGLKAALVTTGIGALLVGAGFAINELMDSNASGPAPQNQRGGSRGGGTYINIEGDVGRREMDRFLDESRSGARNEISMNEGMQP